VLQIDGFGHESNMRAIRLIGEAVIPELTRGSDAAPPS
jgi:hypothetical protein